MEQRLSLVTLGVTDLARARAFYEALGWHTKAEQGADVVFFQAGGMAIALWGRGELAADSGVDDNGGWGGITLAHNVGSPAEVDRVLAEADAGATVVRAGAETFWGGPASSGSARSQPSGAGRAAPVPGRQAHQSSFVRPLRVLVEGGPACRHDFSRRSSGWRRSCATSAGSQRRRAGGRAAIRRQLSLARRSERVRQHVDAASAMSSSLESSSGRVADASVQAADEEHPGRHAGRGEDPRVVARAPRRVPARGGRRACRAVRSEERRSSRPARSDRSVSNRRWMIQRGRAPWARGTRAQRPNR